MMAKLNQLDSLFQNLDYSMKKSALVNDFSKHVDEITQAYETLKIFGGNPETLTEHRIKKFIKENIKSSG